MNSVGVNRADVRFNCSSICINDEHIRGQFGGHSLVETSCKPEPHVFHLGCITRHLDEQSEASLDQRRCSECGQPALPLIRKGLESVNDDESPYCESRMLNVCRSGNLRTLNWHLDKDKTLANQPYHSALTGHPEYLLAVALKHQHTDLARTLIDHGADVNAADHQGETPLHIAAHQRSELTGHPEYLLAVALKHQHTDLVRTLIDQGADVNAADHQGETPLHNAARQRCTEVFNILIEAGANINNVLRTAVREGNDSLLEYLISNELSQSNLNIALREAAGQGQSQYLVLLFNKGANDLNGALREAAGQGQKQCLETLISPRVSQRTPDLNGALCAAAEGGQTECLGFLIEKGANELDHALYRAILTQNNPSRTLLVEEGANITTVVHTAAKKGDWEFFNYLNDPTEINATDGEGQTPLHITAANGDKTCLNKLIEKGAKVNATNNNGETALHLAARWGQTDCLKKLLDKKVDVNVKIHIDGATPLHMAAQNGHIESVRELLKNYQTSVNEQMNDGRTALHLAASGDHAEAIQILLNFDPSLAKEKDNLLDQTALHLAAYKGHTEAIQTLLTIAPSLAKEKDIRGNTALHLAASGDHTEAIQTLLAFDRSLAKEKDNDGQTALHAAASNGHTEAIQTLLTIPSSQAKKKEKDKSVRTALAAAVNTTAFAVHTEATQSLQTIDPSQAKKKEKDKSVRTALAAAVNTTAFAVHTEATQPLQTIDRSLAKEKDNDGQTALHKAASQGHTEAIQTLLTIAPYLAKEKDNNGRTALNIASFKGHTEATQALL
ncbi:ankyrin repeat domain-containing protein [Salinisphaera sp. G21_0]|uniref:ankyrin repeat domain-containing protein n=1 Tax=Salinisphaera sp. G21_0 TaxID=2821094 RepID=UPI001ADCE678|nr:ankyrin repeat domain-containing protein [Salinisphaera sp. G21_0]MBO9484096.1 ankyrin repeat domain-containing protein [Salinisphaera sp. G21_0]